MNHFVMTTSFEPQSKMQTHYWAWQSCQTSWLDRMAGWPRTI